jgi:hypothetical protein
VRRRSKKGQAIDRKRAALNQELVIAPRACQLRGPHCTGRATCWHERRKRSSNGSILNRLNLLAACAPCNGDVEDDPEWGRQFTLRPGDAEWEACSAAYDR